MRVCLLVCVYSTYVPVPGRTKEGIRSHGKGVISGCETVGANSDLQQHSFVNTHTGAHCRHSHSEQRKALMSLWASAWGLGGGFNIPMGLREALGP